MKKIFIFFSVSETTKKHLAALFLYSLLAYVLLSPTGSGKFIPKTQDAATHIAAIVQSKAALQEGQFPLRTAPLEYKGWKYPKFQFYGPTLYFFTSIINSIIAPNNPYITFKIILFLSFWLGGFFLFRLSLFFTRHFSASVLAGFAYMAAPYFIIDAHWRYALAEVLGLGVIPALLFYNLKLFLNPDFSLKDWLLSSFFCYCLMTIHLISFVNTSLFFGIFILSLLNSNNWNGLFRIATAYLWGCLLGAWFLAPIFFDADSFSITRHVSDTLMKFNWLTPLQRLLSITSSSPQYPHPGNLSGPFYPAIGWPLLIGFMICLFGTFCGKMKPYTSLVLKLMLLFLLAIFMTWSPFDFWKYLPKVLTISQYTYRLLLEALWIGALLMGFALSVILEEKMSEWLIIPLGIWLIGLSSASWLAYYPHSTINVEKIIEYPFLGYHQHSERNYLISPLSKLGKSAIPPSTSIQTTQEFCQQKHSIIQCSLPTAFPGGLTQLPILYYPHLLTISVDGKKFSYYPTTYKNQNIHLVLAGLNLSPGAHTVLVEFTGISWANKLSLIMWILSGVIGVILLGFRFTSIVHRSKRFSPPL